LPYPVMSLAVRATLLGIPDRLADLAYRAGSTVVTRIPDSLARATGRNLGLLCWALQTDRRRVLSENLRNNSLLTNRGDASRQTRLTFGNFGESVVETLQLNHLSQDDLIRRVSIDNEQAISDLPPETGAILLTVHTANWEWAGAALSARGYPVRALVRNHSPRVNRFYNRLRSRFGVQTSQELRQSERSGEERLLVLFCDRNGRKTRALNLSRAAERAAALALRRGWHLIPGWTTRTRAGHYRVELGPATRPGRDTRMQCAREAETFLREKIKSNPDQWFAFEPLLGPDE
jgi:KDO2-lipid IV(A) lauroyltransferase